MQQDWNPVVVDKRGQRMTGESKKQHITRALRTGSAVAEKKFTAGANKSAHSGVLGNAKKIEESEEMSIATAGKKLGIAIQKGRMEKKMNQKDLAQAINEKASVINQYETGKAIPNPAIINKMERVLGVKLPRPKKK